MHKSSKGPKTNKFRKPHADFPLFPHATGRWAKKVRGKLHYFGKCATDAKGEAALNLWLEQKDELLAGRTPRPTKDSFTIADLCNEFLNFKRELLESDELAQGTFDRYYGTCKYLTAWLGKSRQVADLQPIDFQSLRARMAKRWGVVALGNEIQIVRSIFRYGSEVELLEKTTRFGPGFKKPSAKAVRKTRNEKGPKQFEPAQVRVLLENATTNMKAMLLLGLNGALGNTELALLPVSAIELDAGWLNYARTKTGIMRRIPLWPESVEAIRAVMSARGKPSKGKEELLFIGVRGADYIGNHKGYRVDQEFKRVARRAGIEGRTFYDLRRTFQTVGERSHDLSAVQAIMGHAANNSDMSAVYRQTVEDERLLRVVKCVRDWLYSGKPDEGDGPDTIPFRSVG